ncbi:MAG: helix-turn-helix domain-containing protein [Paludibacter sp.]|nr:helix-turn-helix domain-containing protein [Paludibacter sp.]
MAFMKKACGYSFEELIQPCKMAPVTWYRQIMMYVMSQEGLSAKSIGRLTHRDRTTVLYSLRRVQELIDVKDKFTIRVIDKLNKLKENDISY